MKKFERTDQVTASTPGTGGGGAVAGDDASDDDGGCNDERQPSAQTTDGQPDSGQSVMVTLL